MQKPDKVDTTLLRDPPAVSKGNVVKGGLNVVDKDVNTVSVIATAAVEACYDIKPEDWQLC